MNYPRAQPRETAAAPARARPPPRWPAWAQTSTGAGTKPPGSARCLRDGAAGPGSACRCSAGGPRRRGRVRTGAQLVDLARVHAHGVLLRPQREDVEEARKAFLDLPLNLRLRNPLAQRALELLDADVVAIHILRAKVPRSEPLLRRTGARRVQDPSSRFPPMCRER